jgi:hypothetical protein
VNTPTAGQNMSVSNLTRANTAGSEPSGDLRRGDEAMEKTLERPASSTANCPLVESSQRFICAEHRHGHYGSHRW